MSSFSIPPNAEKTRESDFKAHLSLGLKDASNRSWLHAFAYAYSQSIFLFVTAGCFYYSAWLVDTCQMCYLQVITVFAAVVFSSQALAEASALTPNYSQAKIAAGRLLRTIDQVANLTSTLPSTSSQPPSMPPIYESLENFPAPPPTKPDIVVFHNVRFAYPNRPKAKILRGFSLSLKAGQTVALVGSSGCGKSTVVQLLVRFYDPTDGFVTYEGDDLRSRDSGFLRRRIAYVQQDPYIFGGSFFDNIVYGLPEAEVVAARRSHLAEKIAKIVQLHDFIVSYPDKYDHYLGPKGHALSGGQRQRLALARALLRRPRVLILDEATSALDSATEAALLREMDVFARENEMARIVIAHRLSTVKNADLIAVVNDGKVQQLGDHQTLVSDKDGLYYRMTHSHLYRFVS